METLHIGQNARRMKTKGDSLSTVNDFSTYSLVSLDSEITSSSRAASPGRMPSELDEKEGFNNSAILGVYSDYSGSQNWRTDLVNPNAVEVDETQDTILRMPSPNSGHNTSSSLAKRNENVSLPNSENKVLDLCSAPELTSVRPVTLRVPLRSTVTSLSDSISETSNPSSDSCANGNLRLNAGNPLAIPLHHDAEILVRASLTPGGNEEIVHKWMLLQGFTEVNVKSIIETIKTTFLTNSLR
jgi:hypothetical protein